MYRNSSSTEAGLAMALRTLALFGATITVGLLAGVFALYSHTIMPGLHHTDDRTFVGAFQAIDRAIINPVFIGGTFLGALVLTIAAAITNRGSASNRLVLVAAVLVVLAVAITGIVNVPLNDAIKSAGDPGQITDVAAVRANFHEVRWAVWNAVRTLLSVVALVCLVWAVYRHGQETATATASADLASTGTNAPWAAPAYRS
jgi:uncharacterized membrane protein